MSDNNTIIKMDNFKTKNNKVEVIPTISERVKLRGRSCVLRRGLPRDHDQILHIKKKCMWCTCDCVCAFVCLCMYAGNLYDYKENKDVHFVL